MAAPPGVARSAKMTIEGLPELERRLDQLVGLCQPAMTALIGTDLVDPPYPYFLEYGTSRMPAYPAARPAFDERYPEAVKTANAVIGAVLDRLGSTPGGLTLSSENNAIKVGLEAGALPIANRWKELARYRTGTYRRSIFVRVVEGSL